MGTALALLALLNVITFAAFALDKSAAQAGRPRIPERTLLTLALVGGSLGALTGQQLLRHKTRKEPFRTLLLAIIGLQIVGGVAWLWLWATPAT